ncbi:C4-dicarboxylate transporter/malic acid transporter [Poronia punctata]|nr:C4-dicarboxylate transporter/malic acid transporter [Poronia punctata]
MAIEERQEPARLSPEHTKIIFNAMSASSSTPRNLANDIPLISMTNDGSDGRPGTPFDDTPTAVNSRRQSFSKDVESQNNQISVDINDPNRPKIGLRERMHHFTWAWFTWPMSTGGLSLLIYAQPYQFPGLRQIGFAVYILNLIIFVTLVAAMITRFALHKGDLRKSITHPREGFFLPTFFLAVATIITSTERYVVPENDAPLRAFILIAFWTYLLATLVLAISQYSYIFAHLKIQQHTVMPTLMLPIFPSMLSGTIASVIAETQPEIAAIPIIVAGLTCQGLGISVAVLVYAQMIGRLIQSDLPNREHRPGLFMNVGPPAFTALAFIGMANGLPDTFDHKGDGILDANVIRTLAVIAAIFLWALSLWWWAIGAVAVISSPPKYFHLGWWAMVFPNTGFILATISIAKELQNVYVLRFTSALSIILVSTYLYVLVNQIKAFIKQDIMYPGRDEDVEDH